uniref:NADH dehydrogenase subunit 2 n=1 Tax=Luperomorpha xanthodera TaxID=715851 RepID=UPI002551DC23|nr:NADH dehydrogenase subunit 2 [Luperomorpha xanthodera]WFQ81650.1 NADH dehydrogenase subunit 2 [Luperomorpha xanthodera]
MIKIFKIFFFSTLMMGTFIVMSAYSWFNMWIGLEINLLSIIPLMKSHLSIYPAEASLKYFIVQALASTIILFSIILMLNSSDYVPTISNFWLMMILNSGLLTKLGAAPFHVWFPEVMEGLNWMNCLILLTWQKIAPMILIMYNLSTLSIINFTIIFSSLIGSLMGLNQTSLRKIMAYSSINHIGWMIAGMLNFKMIWFIYFIIYSLTSINLIILFENLKSYYLPQLLQVLNQNKLIKLFFMMNFFSLGGLPPFLGFLPKWMVINNLISNSFYSLSFILIILTLVTLYYYIRISFSSLTILSIETLIKINFSSMIWFFLNIITLLSLTLCTMIFNYL